MKKNDPVKDENLESTPAPTNKASDLAYHYWTSTKHAATLIRASEIKAGFVLSFYGLLLNFVYKGTDAVVESGTGDTFLIVMLCIWFATVVTSIFFAVQCFIPKTEDKFSANVFYFQDVISKFGDVKSFSKAFFEVATNEEKFLNQLGEQIYIISKIASDKFRLVQRSIIFLGIGLVFLLIILLYIGLRIVF